MTSQLFRPLGLAIGLAALAAAAPPAQAARNELSVELGGLGTRDANYGLFSDTDRIGTWGVRGGVGLSRHLAVVASFHHGATGNRLDGYETDGDYVEGAMQFRNNQLALGPKFELAVAPWLRPYGTVQAVAFQGRILLDDDADQDDDLNELSYRDVAPAGVVALGLDLVPYGAKKAVGVGSHLELGYGHAAPLRFADEERAQGEPVSLGELQFSGFYVRWGVGLRF
jgi:hypothetical protein